MNYAKKITYAGIIAILCQGIPYYRCYKQTLHRSNLEASEPISVSHRVIKEVCPDRHISKVLDQSKYKYVLTAIASVESSYRPQVKGDSGDSFGLYQIQSRHWGRFGDSLEDQTKKAETILDALGAKKDIKTAIRKYNGSGQRAKAYQKKVLSLVRKMEQRERELSG